MDDEHVNVLKLSPEEWEKFLDALNNPLPPSQALIDLMRRTPIWDDKK